MAITATPYGAFLTDLGTGVHNLTTDTDKVALLGPTYTPDFDAHVSYADVKAAELGTTGTGYTAGGATLANKSFTFDPSLDVATLSADPVNIAALNATVHYAAVYRVGSSDANSRLIGLINFGEDRTYAAELFTLSFPTGVISLQTA